MSSSADSKLWPDGIYLDVRSQSEVLGVVLVFGIVLLGAFTVVALGVTAVSDTESSLSDDRAEKVLTQLDSKAGLVALDETESQQVRFPSDGSNDFSVDEDEGQFRIQIINRTTGDPSKWANPLVNVSLGAVVYEKADSKMAYQGGGVFRSGASNSTMISPPEFHYRDGTLTLPIVNVTGNQFSGDSATITHSNQTRVFPIPGDVNKTNPLENHEVKLTVQSEYYEGWGQYFEERTDGAVEYDHDEQRVTLVLRTPAGEQTVQESIAATAASGDLTLRGDGTVDYNTDSYNSSEGSYEDTRSGKGNITLAGTFETGSETVRVNGSVEVGTEAKCHQQSVIAGIIISDGYDNFGHCDSAAEDGAFEESVSINDGGLNVETYIKEQVTEIRANPTDSENITSNDRIDFDDGEATLHAGRYYFEKLTIEDDTLVLDTGDSNEIDIAVDEYTRLSDGDILIKGTGSVRMYINGTELYSHQSEEYNLLMEDDSSVTTDGPVQNSSQFWIYGKDSFEALLDGPQGQNDPTIEGVIFAPTLSGQPSGMSNVTLDGATLYGGIVAGDVTSTHSSIHHDKSLSAVRAVPEETRIATITYLHITENEIEIS